MSNPHIENAIYTIGEANNPNSVWESSDTERIALQIEANTRATLALAYEQRTANLIALYNMTESNCEGLSTTAPMSRANWDSAAKQIKERLNLT